jgi:hypothetical protein
LIPSYPYWINSCDADVLTSGGFNANPKCVEEGYLIPTHYDLCNMAWASAGLPKAQPQCTDECDSPAAHYGLRLLVGEGVSPTLPDNAWILSVQ